MSERDANRGRQRAEELERYADQYATAQRLLEQVYGEGERVRSRFVIRRNLILRRPYQGRRASDPLRPSPAAPLVVQKGWALHLYLIALFEAQSRRRPGGAVQNVRPLRSTDRHVGWVDLLPAATTATDRATGMMRQLKRALALLSRNDLVELYGRQGSVGRFERFQLLKESGRTDRAALALPLFRADHYDIPHLDASLPGDPAQRPPAAMAGTAEAMQLPAAFFRGGWVHVLSAAEIMTYLMIKELETRYPRASADGVYVTEPNREAWYGISRDIYESHRQLAAYGLIERLDDPNRRPNGKILRRPGKGEYLQPLRFRTLPAGLDRPALPTVVAALTGVGRAERRSR